MGDTALTGRAHWLIAFAHTRLSRNDASRTAALRAAALARQAGDAHGLANALNVLSFSCTDIAERLAVLHQAAAAFERAGYVYGRMLVLGNLSITFAELGLWRHACRLGEQCMALAERIGARLNLALEMGAVLMWQIELGDVAGARARWPAYDALVSALDEPVTGNDRELWAAELVAGRGHSAGALKRLRAFLRQVRTTTPASSCTCRSRWPGRCCCGATPRRPCAPRGAASRCCANAASPAPASARARTSGGGTAARWRPTAVTTRPGPRCSTPTACCWSRCATCATKACAAAT